MSLANITSSVAPGATDDLIWTKLEAYRADFGTALLPQTVLTVLHSLCIDLR